MDAHWLEEFLLWCLVINVGIYMIVSLAWLSLRRFYVQILVKTMGVSEETITSGVFTYIGHYKLFITVFNFVPWLALVVMKN
jgi:hypothetical protein